MMPIFVFLQVSDLSEQLESEEQTRQKLQLEKNSIEQKATQLIDENCEMEDKLAKLSKEKKTVDDRLTVS